MGRVKGAKKDPNPRKFPEYEQFWRNIDYLRLNNNITAERMAGILGISIGTYKNRHLRAEDTTGKEVTRAALYFNIALPSLYLPLVGMPVYPHELDLINEGE